MQWDQRLACESLYRALRDLPQRLQDLLIGGPFSIVDLDKPPAQHPLFVDDIGGRMRPALAGRIKDPITVDDFMVFIFKQRKIEISGKSLSQFLYKLLRILVAVDADGQYLNLFVSILGQKAFQLPELLGAVRSPMSAVKDQDDVFLAAEVGKRN
jgi:hypothetical protein